MESAKVVEMRHCGFEPVVETVCAVALVLYLIELSATAHFTEIPEASGLVFAIRDDIPAVTFGRYIGYTLGVPD